MFKDRENNYSGCLWAIDDDRLGQEGVLGSRDSEGRFSERQPLFISCGLA